MSRVFWARLSGLGLLRSGYCRLGSKCGCGGIGRRTRFRFWRLWRGGSSPFTRTIFKSIAELLSKALNNLEIWGALTSGFEGAADAL